MDLCEIAATHQALTQVRPTMSDNQPANPLANLNIYHVDQEAKRFQLIYEGRVLDANVYHDWILAGRCLRYAEQTYPPSGLNRFQIWVNWTEQRVPTDEVEVADTAAMAALWNDLALTPRLVRTGPQFDDTLSAQRSREQLAELIPGTKMNEGILKFKALGEMAQRSRVAGGNYVRLEDLDAMAATLKTAEEVIAAAVSKLETRTTQRDRYAELLNDIIRVSGHTDPLLGNPPWQGPDLCAASIHAMWLIEKQRLTLDDAGKVIEMFMPNIGKCFGIDVGALNRTMMNIEMVKRGKPPAPETPGGMIDDTPEVNLTIEALRRENFELRQKVGELTGENNVLQEMVLGDDR